MSDNYKKKYKPSICTQNPFKLYIPYKERIETLVRIKQECIDAYGQDIATECPHRMDCTKCSGRPLPWKSKTAKPYLKVFAKEQGIKEGEDIFVADCSNCPIVNNCFTPCEQVNDYLAKDRVREVKASTHEDMSNYAEETASDEQFAPLTGDVPWDCLNDLRTNVIKKRVFEQKDFYNIALELKLTNQARAKYEFYAGLTTLSEYAIMRKFIEENKTKIKPNRLDVLTRVYYSNKNRAEVAIELNITRQAVNNMINKFIKANNIKWDKFVTKKGTKTIYSIPEVIRN